MRFILIVLCLAILPFSVQAMICKNDLEGIYKYEIVFKGEAVSTKKVDEKDLVRSDHYNTPPRVTRFKVLKKYKGPISEFVDVYHMDSNTVYFKDKDGNKVRGSLPGISINFKMGDVRYMFLNRHKESNQYYWHACGPWVYNINELLPLEEFKARADMFSEISAMLPSLPHAVARRDQFSDFYLKQAMFHEKYNDFEAALEAYRRSLEMRLKLRANLVPLNKTLDELLEIDMGAYEFYKFGVGKIYFKQEKFENALSLFDRILKAMERYHPLSKEGKTVTEMTKKYRDMTIAELEKQNP